MVRVARSVRRRRYSGAYRAPLLSVTASFCNVVGPVESRNICSSTKLFETAGEVSLQRCEFRFPGKIVALLRIFGEIVEFVFLRVGVIVNELTNLCADHTMRPNTFAGGIFEVFIEPFFAPLAIPGRGKFYKAPALELLGRRNAGQFEQRRGNIQAAHAPCPP